MNEVNERSTCYWVLRFYDEDGELEEPSHIWTQIDCLTSGTSLQAKTLEGTTSSIWTKIITPVMNRITGSGDDDERRLLTVTARYGGDLNKEVTGEFDWLVKNLRKVT